MEDEVKVRSSCIITQSLMVDPVIAMDGNSYEREAITRWLQQKKTSPLTGKPMGTTLIENRELRVAIREAHPEVVPLDASAEMREWEVQLNAEMREFHSLRRDQDFSANDSIFQSRFIPPSDPLSVEMPHPRSSDLIWSTLPSDAYGPRGSAEMLQPTRAGVFDVVNHPAPTFRMSTTSSGDYTPIDLRGGYQYSVGTTLGEGVAESMRVDVDAVVEAMRRSARAEASRTAEATAARLAAERENNMKRDRAFALFNSAFFFCSDAAYRTTRDEINALQHSFHSPQQYEQTRKRARVAWITTLVERYQAILPTVGWTIAVRCVWSAVPADLEVQLCAALSRGLKDTRTKMLVLWASWDEKVAKSTLSQIE